MTILAKIIICFDRLINCSRFIVHEDIILTMALSPTICYLHESRWARNTGGG